MNVTFDLKDFNKKMNGLTGYAEGFVTTLSENENKVADTIADEAIDSAYTYIDTMARMHPDRLHHVYEWPRAGDASSRLFNFISEAIGKNKYQIRSNFIDSKMPASTSGQVFTNKASIMEAGKPLVIKPKKSPVLVFEVDGETIFTPNEVHIANPGGNTSGSFEAVVKDFQQYFESTFPKSKLSSKIKKLGRVFRPGQNPSKAAGQTAALKFIIGLKEL